MPTNPPTCRFGTRPSADVALFAANVTITMGLPMVANRQCCSFPIARKPLAWSRLSTRPDRV